MNEDQIKNIFLKIEAKLEKTFTSLHNYETEQKVRALQEINEASWMMERLNPILFKKITKDLDIQINEISTEIDDFMSKVDGYSLTESGLVLKLNEEEIICPIASIHELREKVQKPKYFLGYFIQLSYLMRPENLFPISLWLAIKENKI